MGLSLRGKALFRPLSEQKEISSTLSMPVSQLDVETGNEASGIIGYMMRSLPRKHGLPVGAKNGLGCNLINRL